MRVCVKQRSRPSVLTKACNVPPNRPVPETRQTALKKHPAQNVIERRQAKAGHQRTFTHAEIVRSYFVSASLNVRLAVNVHFKKE